MIHNDDYVQQQCLNVGLINAVYNDSFANDAICSSRKGEKRGYVCALAGLLMQVTSRFGVEKSYDTRCCALIGANRW